MDPIALSDAQQFQMEVMARAIDSCNDLASIRKIAKELLMSWMMQKSATAWAIKQTLPRYQKPEP